MHGYVGTNKGPCERCGALRYDDRIHWDQQAECHHCDAPAAAPDPNEVRAGCVWCEKCRGQEAERRML